MEPTIPSGNKEELVGVAQSVWRDSAALRGMLPEPSRKAVADVVRSMNGYYSNLIEGHKTRPADIEAALAHSFSKSPKERERQMLHAAHLDTLSLAEEGLSDDTPITSPEYMCWLHKEFFKRLPDGMRVVQTSDGKEYRFEPGAIREANVSVGAHLAPDSRSLGKMLQYFDHKYAPHISDSPESLIAACASHHRLVWIHPFDDGNGRIARMATHLWFKKAGAGGSGLWTLSRGLARNLEEYRTRLSQADEKRMNDYSGAKQTGKIFRIPPVGLNPVARLLGDQRGGDHRAGDPKLFQSPGDHEPARPSLVADVKPAFLVASDPSQELF